MKKQRRIAIFICICLVLSLLLPMFLSGCGKKEEVANGMMIYYFNSDMTGLVKVPYEIPEDEALNGKMTAEEIEKRAKDILEQLKQPSDDVEMIQPIPQEVKIKSCEFRGSILDLDFSKEYLQIDHLKEKLMRAAIVQSRVEINGINAVLFTVGDEPLKDRLGYDIGLMTEDDFVESTGSSPSAYQTGELTLYFANEKGDKLVEQNVTVRYNSNLSREKMIVEKLMQGPESGAYPTINPNANLLSVTIKDQICYVNFDSTFLTSAFDILPEVTVYSIVNSLVEGTEATQVQITINGESNAKYMDVVDLSKPLNENYELVAADKKK